HLITQEAVQLYLDRLAPAGVLVFHISNRYLELAPVLAGIAAAENLAAVGRAHIDLTEQERAMGLLPSTWVVLARSANDLGPLTADRRWVSLKGDASAAWTDDFSNVWSVFRW